MALKVEVYQKEKVRPSSPTPQTLRYHKLSLVDAIVGYFYGPHVLFYPSGAGPRPHDYDELKESLSKTLSILYPLAGRLKDGSIIECNDEGADFVRANVTNYDLGEFLRDPKQEDLLQLLPLDPYPDAIDPAMPMLGVQVNRFRCGGTAVGFCTWHGVVDGIGMATLYNTMAAINRGEEGVVGGPVVVDVTATFSPAIPNMSKAMLTGFAGMKKELGGKYTSKRFVFSKQDIERMRNQYSQSEHHRRPSRVEALSAFLWAAVIRATLCLGNILQGTDSVWEVNGGAAGGLVTGRSLVGRVVEAMDKFTNHYVREMQAEVDFGWGKPIWIGMPQTLLDVALFVDTKDGGVEVWIGLDHEVMCNLDKDMEFNAYVSFAYIVSESSCRLSSAL
nr:vinorine synthase-like [Ipomoea batatas]